jgi:HD-like signal output (HDOD) protein
MKKEKILAALEKNGDLPVLPDILARLQDLLNRSDVHSSDIVRLIELEPVLAGMILNIANSAFYKSGYQEIDTLLMAVNKLGFDKIQQLIFSLKLTRLFSGISHLDRFQFWKHSLGVAHFTQMLANYTTKIPASVRHAAYLSGLMHDVGIIVFCYLIPEEYAAFLKDIKNEGTSFETLEMETFGIDHNDLGARFIHRWWRMNKLIVQAVRHHRFPFAGNDEEKICQQLVHLANGICTLYGEFNGIDETHEPFHEGAWEALNLSLKDTEGMMADVSTAISQSVEMLGLTI